MARIRPFWMPIAFCAAVVAGALGVAGTWPGFEPKRVTVTGNRVVASAEILARAAVAPHESIWLQNTRAMAQRIETIPYISSAAVHRIPPASMMIVVKERSPFAVLRSGDDTAVIDRGFRALTRGGLDEELPLFVVGTGADLTPGAFVKTRDAAELLEAYDTMTTRGIVPAQLAFDRFGGLVVTTRDGLRLLLGSENQLGQKLTLAKAIMSQVVGHEQRVAAIDLRAPSAPVLVYR